MLPRLLLTGALVVTGCVGNGVRVPDATAPAASTASGGMGGLWGLAPADAVEGMVIRDGALARAIALVADTDRSAARTVFEEQVQKQSGLPFNPLSLQGWAGAGLDPQRGAAAFTFADPKRGKLLVLPVTDRALFRHAFGLSTRIVDGREVDRLDDKTECEPAAGRYLCARSLEVIAAAAAPHAAPLAASATELEEHGELEIYVSRDAHGLARFNHDRDSPGWISAVTGTLRLRDDGATLHVHATGSLATPAARGYYAAELPPELVAAARGALTVARVHVDPTAIFPPSADVEPAVRSELLEQLTGDAVMIPFGSGFAGATVILPVNDASRVEAFVKKRCAEEAAKHERRVLGSFKVEAHGCAGVIDTRKLLVPVGFPEVPITAVVADRRLVITLGDAGKVAPAEPLELDAAAAKRALEERETLLFSAHDLGVGPEVGPGALFRAAIPIFGDRVASAVEAWDYASAHISEGILSARVTDEGADLTIDLTSFAPDPAAAHEAYGAALARRFAGDEAGYRAALASVEHGFPGTRAARRAAEVRRGEPFFGAGVTLMATLDILGNAGAKKK